ncbi:MAG: SDR family oxidoreductase [Clostridia bacterium]|nr:SDR family oxidoreductase [Clostridia bacterium]
MCEDLFGVKGKNILVTGASSGIGKEVSLLLGRLGARVSMVGRNEGRLNEILKLLDGDEHRVYPYDLNDLDHIQGLVRDIGHQAEGLYGLVHAAGINNMSSLDQTRFEQYMKIFNINLFSFIELIKGFVKKGSCEMNGGSVVGISSVMARKACAGSAFYGASKAALESIVKTAATEMAAKRIRINAVVPAYVDTRMFQQLCKNLTEEQRKKLIEKIPLGLGQPSQVAWAVVFLLGKTSSWVTGTSLVVDGGYLLT